MAKHEELTPVETPEGLKQPGRIQKAPENFLTPTDIEEVTQGRRNFLRGSFAAAVAAMTGRHAFAHGNDAVNAASGDPCDRADGALLCCDRAGVQCPRARL